MPSGSLVGVDVKYDRENRASSVQHFPLLFCVKTRYIASWLAGWLHVQCVIQAPPRPALPTNATLVLAAAQTDTRPAGHIVTHT